MLTLSQQSNMILFNVKIPVGMHYRSYAIEMVLTNEAVCSYSGMNTNASPAQECVAGF